MSHETPQNQAPRPTAPRKLPAGEPTGRWKWLAGAAVAAVLVGGGIYALSQGDRAETRTEFTYDDNAPAEAFDSASLDDANNNAAPNDALVEPAATQAGPRTAAAPRARQVAAAEPIYEEVVGVSPAGAAAYDGRDDIVVQGSRRPQWTRTPTAHRLSTFYPERALERGREGEARIRCTVVEDGALDCVRASEAPANAGFGNAALRVARTFRHAPERADGSSAVGTPVNLRVVFRLAEDNRRG